jgi:hypothetical protein
MKRLLLAFLALFATAATAGNLTLTWTPPTENTDGSPYTDAAGYEIYYGPSSGSYTSQVTLDDPNLTSFVIEGLDPGNVCAVITARNLAGIESAFSNEACSDIPSRIPSAPGSLEAEGSQPVASIRYRIPDTGAGELVAVVPGETPQRGKEVSLPVTEDLSRIVVLNGTRRQVIEVEGKGTP